MCDFPVVLSVEEAARLLKAPVAAVAAELESGRLRGFRIGNEWRVTERALREFVGVPDDSPSGIPEREVGSMVSRRAANADLQATLSGGLAWTRIPGFDYTWPMNVVEPFPEAYRTQIALGSQSVTVSVGFTDRDAAGMKQRRRAVVFIGSPNLVPAVEFSGANDFDETGLMASVVKLPRRSGGGHRHLRPGQPIPAEYAEGFRLGIYSSIVRGPYAAGSMAVYATKDELDVMAHHGLIRALWKGWI